VEKCGKPWQQRASIAAPFKAGCGDGPAGSSRAAIAPVRACSACAGDYEDPDRTAGEPDEESDEDEPRAREDLQEAAEKSFRRGCVSGGRGGDNNEDDSKKGREADCAAAAA
jgi:hypothetical protein